MAADHDEPGTPSPKRQRLSSSNYSNPSSSGATPQTSSDLQAISAALEAEDKKRAQAVARQAAEAGETEWVLDFPGVAASNIDGSAALGPLIVDAGSLDAEDEEVNFGRRSYGNFKRKKRTTEVGVAAFTYFIRWLKD